MVPREDIARVIYAAMLNKDTHGLAFDVLGPKEDSVTVKEEVARVAKNHEDTFEGFY
jgi:hypothetical protein